MSEVPTLVGFLEQLASGGVIGVIVAFLLEHVKPFQALKAEVKKWLVFASFLILPLGARAMLQFVPAETIALLEPYFSALALGFAAWAASQVAHNWDKRK
jgi:hypothetical protein